MGDARVACRRTTTDVRTACMGMIAPIVVSVDVPVEPLRAFTGFAALDAWWPRAYTWSGDVLERMVMELRPDGLCSELGPHGFRCDWGRVLTVEPGVALTFSWQIAPTRAPEPNPDRASRVRVAFDALADGGTRVALEHDRFERHGEGAAEYRAAMAAAEGWPWLLRQYSDWLKP